MKTPILFGVITLAFLWYNLIVSISIINYLRSKGKDVSLFRNWFFIKGRIFAYLPVYKETTLKYNGRVGGLYFHFYLSFFLAIAFLVWGLLSL